MKENVDSLSSNYPDTKYLFQRMEMCENECLRKIFTLFKARKQGAADRAEQVRVLTSLRK